MKHIRGNVGSGLPLCIRKFLSLFGCYDGLNKRAIIKNKNKKSIYKLPFSSLFMLFLFYSKNYFPRYNFTPTLKPMELKGSILEGAFVPV
jgi:hypothetical protein